ncbi:MAG: HAD hydrolase family protein [Patescibacteria group bacterium]
MATTDKLKTLTGVIFDGDGVLFDGNESRITLPDNSVGVLKIRSLQDGQGISFLRALGLKVVFASGENEPLPSIVKKINDLPAVKNGEWTPVDYFTGELKKGGKVASLEAWLHKQGLRWEDCAYVGDDRTDLEAMKKAGLKVVPANARRVVQKIADIQLTKAGGAGAIREFAEMVLDARGVDEATLPAA